jgi:hypothetical protein
MQDNFEGGTYSLTEGATSPNGKWKNEFIGGAGVGQAGVRNDGSGNLVFWCDPQFITGQTHASLTRSVQEFTNFEATGRFRTIAHNRPVPNIWEVAWLMWRYTSTKSQYTVCFKTDGALEVTRRENSDGTENQVFLAIQPTGITFTLGTWYNFKIRMVGRHMQMWLNGTKFIDLEDNGGVQTSNPADIGRIPGWRLNKGAFCLYSEDAEAEYDDIVVKALPDPAIDTNTDKMMQPAVDAVKTGQMFGLFGNIGEGLFNGNINADGASNSVVYDSQGIHRQYTSATAASSRSGFSTPNAIARRYWSPYLKCKIKFDTSLTGQQCLIGFASGTPTTDSTPLANLHGALAVFRDGLNSKNWTFVVNSGDATQTTASMGLTPVPDRWYIVEVWLHSYAVAMARVNNTAWITISTDLPALDTAMFVFAEGQKTTADSTNARVTTIDFVKYWMEPGITAVA